MSRLLSWLPGIGKGASSTAVGGSVSPALSSTSSLHGSSVSLIRRPAAATYTELPVAVDELIASYRPACAQMQVAAPSNNQPSAKTSEGLHDSLIEGRSVLPQTVLLRLLTATLLRVLDLHLEFIVSLTTIDEQAGRDTSTRKRGLSSITAPPEKSIGQPAADSTAAAAGGGSSSGDFLRSSVQGPSNDATQRKWGLVELAACLADRYELRSSTENAHPASSSLWMVRVLRLFVALSPDCDAERVSGPDITINWGDVVRRYQRQKSRENSTSDSETLDAMETVDAVAEIAAVFLDVAEDGTCGLLRALVCSTSAFRSVVAQRVREKSQVPRSGRLLQPLDEDHNAEEVMLACVDVFDNVILSGFASWCRMGYRQRHPADVLDRDNRSWVMGSSSLLLSDLLPTCVTIGGGSPCCDPASEPLTQTEVRLVTEAAREVVAGCKSDRKGTAISTSSVLIAIVTVARDAHRLAGNQSASALQAVRECLNVCGAAVSTAGSTRSSEESQRLNASAAPQLSARVVEALWCLHVACLRDEGDLMASKSLLTEAVDNLRLFLMSAAPPAGACSNSSRPRSSPMETPPCQHSVGGGGGALPTPSRRQQSLQHQLSFLRHAQEHVRCLSAVASRHDAVVPLMPPQSAVTTSAVTTAARRGAESQHPNSAHDGQLAASERRGWRYRTQVVELLAEVRVIWTRAMTAVYPQSAHWTGSDNPLNATTTENGDNIASDIWRHAVAPRRSSAGSLRHRLFHWRDYVELLQYRAWWTEAASEAHIRLAACVGRADGGEVDPASADSALPVTALVSSSSKLFDECVHWLRALADPRWSGSCLHACRQPDVTGACLPSFVSLSNRFLPGLLLPITVRVVDARVRRALALTWVAARCDNVVGIAESAVYLWEATLSDALLLQESVRVASSKHVIGASGRQELRPEAWPAADSTSSQHKYSAYVVYLANSHRCRAAIKRADSECFVERRKTLLTGALKHAYQARAAAESARWEPGFEPSEEPLRDSNYFSFVAVPPIESTWLICSVLVRLGQHRKALVLLDDGLRANSLLNASFARDCPRLFGLTIDFLSLRCQCLAISLGPRGGVGNVSVGGVMLTSDLATPPAPAPSSALPDSATAAALEACELSLRLIDTFYQQWIEPLHLYGPTEAPVRFSEVTETPTPGDGQGDTHPITSKTACVTQWCAKHLACGGVPHAVPLRATMQMLDVWECRVRHAPRALLLSQGDVHASAGCWDAALVSYSKAYDASLQTRSVSTEVIALQRLGMCYHFLGKASMAVQYLTQARELCHRGAHVMSQQLPSSIVIDASGRAEASSSLRTGGNAATGGQLPREGSRKAARRLLPPQPLPKPLPPPTTSRAASTLALLWYRATIQLGQLFATSGRTREAASLWSEILAFAQLFEDTEVVRAAQKNILRSLLASSQFYDAICAAEALENQALHESAPGDVAVALETLAVAYLAVGDVKKSLDAIDRLEKVEDADTKTHEAAQQLRARALLAQRQDHAAIDVLQQCRQRAALQGDPSEVLRATLRLADALVTVSLHDAKQEFFHVLEVAQGIRHGTAVALDSTGDSVARGNSGASLSVELTAEQREIVMKACGWLVNSFYLNEDMFSVLSTPRSEAHDDHDGNLAPYEGMDGGRDLECGSATAELPCTTADEDGDDVALMTREVSSYGDFDVDDAGEGRSLCDDDPPRRENVAAYEGESSLPLQSIRDDALGDVDLSCQEQPQQLVRSCFDPKVAVELLEVVTRLLTPPLALAACGTTSSSRSLLLPGDFAPEPFVYRSPQQVTDMCLANLPNATFVFYALQHQSACESATYDVIVRPAASPVFHVLSVTSRTAVTDYHRWRRPEVPNVGSAVLPITRTANSRGISSEKLASTAASKPTAVSSNAIDDSDGAEYLYATLRALHDDLWAPVASIASTGKLLHRSECVVVVPHPSLLHIPFSSLVSSKRKAIGQRACVVVTPSLEHLAKHISMDDDSLRRRSHRRCDSWLTSPLIDPLLGGATSRCHGGDSGHQTATGKSGVIFFMNGGDHRHTSGGPTPIATTLSHASVSCLRRSGSSADCGPLADLDRFMASIEATVVAGGTRKELIAAFTSRTIRAIVAVCNPATSQQRVQAGGGEESASHHMCPQAPVAAFRMVDGDLHLSELPQLGDQIELVVVTCDRGVQPSIHDAGCAARLCLTHGCKRVLRVDVASGKPVTQQQIFMVKLYLQYVHVAKANQLQFAYAVALQAAQAEAIRQFTLPPCVWGSLTLVGAP